MDRPDLKTIALMIKSELQEWAYEAQKLVDEERRRNKREVRSPGTPVVSDLYTSPGYSQAVEVVRDPSLCDCPGVPGGDNCIHMYHGKFLAPVRRAV